MLDFKKIELSDIAILENVLKNNDDNSCENNFINLLVWQCKYNNMIAYSEGQLIIKSGYGKRAVFKLPIGDDFEKGMALISDYCGEQKPRFWAQEGSAFEKFKKLYGHKYTIEEQRDSFDYLYLCQDLANLKGKKYHSKRNHISSFSKKYRWHYETITPQNIEKVALLAENWYEENSHRMDDSLLCEKKAVNTILSNYSVLGVKGGAVFVDDEAVAFTLGSPINQEVFDIHIEKALKDYSEAYSVINCEFAKNELAEYKYINREDDMGIEGLRKAKLSYNPVAMVKKYFCAMEEN